MASGDTLELEGQTAFISATAGATGIVTVTVPETPPAGRYWKITRAQIQCLPANTVINEFNLYVAPPFPPGATPTSNYLVDHSYSGDADVADELNPPVAEAGESVIGQWLAALVGAVCTLTITYDQYRTKQSMGR